MNNNNGKIWYQQGIDNSQLKRDADEAIRKFKEMGKSAETEGQRADGAFKSLAGGMAAALSVQQAMALGNAIINVRGEIESLEISFKTLLGSKAEADKMLQVVRDVALISPLSLSDVGTATQMLLSFSIEAGKIPAILEQLGSVSMGNADKFRSLALVYAQVASTGKLMGTDLMQMINAGFNPLSVMAEKAGKSIGDLKIDMENGAISAEMVADAFVTATSEGGKFFGMMAEQGAGLNGTKAQFEGAIEEVLNKWGQANQETIVGGYNLATEMVENYEMIGRALTSLVVTYGTYKVALALATATSKGYTIAQLAQYSALLIAEKAQKLFNAAILKNPYVLAATLIMGIVTALWAFKDRTTEAEKTAARFKAEIKSETEELNTLFSALKKTEQGTNERKKAIESVNEKYGSYLKNLLTERSTIEEITKAQKEATEALVNSISVKMKDDYLKSYAEKQTKAQVSMYESIGDVTSKLTNKQKGEFQAFVESAVKTSNDGFRILRDGMAKVTGSYSGIDSLYSSWDANDFDQAIKGAYRTTLQLNEAQKDTKEIFDSYVETLYPSQNSKEKETVFSNVSVEIEQATKNLAKLKTELSDLRSGKTSSDDYKKAIEAKLAEIESAGKALEILTGKKQGKDDKPVSEYALESDTKVFAARIALMEEGSAKLIAQAEQNKRETIAVIDAEEKEKLEKYKEYIKKGGKEITGEETKIKEQAAELRRIAQEQETKDVVDIKKREAEMLSGLMSEVSSRFTSQLDGQLAEIDRYYDEAVKKAKGHKDVIDKLNESRNKEKSLAGLSNQLYNVGFTEEVALGRNENSSGVGMTERQEIEKTKILKKYALERIKILRQMGTEEANQEADIIQTAVDGYDKKLSKPRSIKNIIDEKAFKAVENHFVKLGSTQEEAAEKTGNFFQKFTDGGAIASDVIGVLQGAFGGVSEELDMALNAAMNIADGFAKGGIVGGIAAAGQELIKVTVGLLTARKQIDQSMIDGYKLYIEAIDRLIDKQIDALESLGGSAFANSLREINNEIEKRTAANIRLLREAQKAGSGLFSHSDGYKTNEILKQQSAYLRQAGIYKTDISRLTEDELVKLRDVADVWARLPEGIRTYIDDLAESKEQLEDLQNQLQDMLLGFEATDIRDAIVDSFTDGAIDNAMADFEAKADDLVAGIMKNIMTNLMLTEPINAAINQLMKGLATYDSDGNITGFKDVNSIEKTVLSNFKETIMSLADGFGKTWEDLSKQFGDMGIDLYGNEPESATRTGSSKGIAQASQTSIDELNGRATVIQSHTFSISEDMKFLRNNSSAILNQLIGIKENTDELRPIREDISAVREGIEVLTTKGITLK